MIYEFAGRDKDAAPGAGRLLAGSMESPELAISLAFRLPANCLEALFPLPDALLLLPTGTAGFFLRAIASRNSLRRAGETCKVEITFIKAKSSCLGIMLLQAHSEGYSFHSSCSSAVPSTETITVDKMFD